jgi:hypothetical protein
MKRLTCAIAAMLFAASVGAAGQGAASVQTAQLRVIVLDQTGGGIPFAAVRITPQPNGTSVEQTADERGLATIQEVPVGTILLHVESPGFDPADLTVPLRRGGKNQTVTLKVAGLQEQVVVADTTSDDRRGNSLTTVLEEEDIEELSDDPDELQAQLEALTGGAGAVFQVDGFRGGRLPTKDQIRQIRFRTNSFSADNHEAGRVQVEIVTRPGLTSWNGSVNTGLRSDVLNARNAFARTETPEQFRRFSGGIRGPLVLNRTSLRFNIDGNRSFDTQPIVARKPDEYITGIVQRPLEATNFTFGLDHGLTKNSTLRFEFRDSQNENRNLGVGDFNLLERAFTRTRAEQQVRTSVQTVLGKKLNELRVQWNYSQSRQQSASTAPAIVVIDEFSAGGAGVSNETDNRTFVVVDDLDFNVKKHAMRVGVRLEGGAYQQEDFRNQNGTFTFGSLDAFLAAAPTTYTRRLGEVATSFSQYQLGTYWQDDFRVSRNLSLSVGVRQEFQSHLKDKFNVMPRFGYTWNPFGWKTTLRGGYGMFYDWYDSGLYDQTLRVNGVDQTDILILNPGYPDPGTGGTTLVGGRVTADPDLKMPYVHFASLGAERPLTPTLTVQASIAVERGYDQLRSRNINAPDAFGVRPQPGIGTIAQIESTDRSALSRLTLGFNYRVPRYRAFLFSNYTLASEKNHTSNPLGLPADSLNPDSEWGPASQDVRHRFNTMVNFPLPLSIRANINANASSAAPFTITTGQDDNRDGVLNDRPAGVGRNSARGKGRVELGVRLTRGFGFGGVPGQDGARAAQGAPAGALPMPPPGGEVVVQGPVGGGARLFGGPGGPQANQRFNLEFYVQAFNLLNRTNFQNFSGNMRSDFFLQPTSASQARRVEVGMQFRF